MSLGKQPLQALTAGMAAPINRYNQEACKSALSGLTVLGWAFLNNNFLFGSCPIACP